MLEDVGCPPSNHDRAEVEDLKPTPQNIHVRVSDSIESGDIGLVVIWWMQLEFRRSLERWEEELWELERSRESPGRAKQKVRNAIVCG